MTNKNNLESHKMIVKKKASKSRKLRVDLTGPDGNAFVLLNLAKSIARNSKMEKAEIDAILAEMMSGDYEHLVETLDNYFGSVLILER